MIETERLLLRRWRARDRAPFAAMNADPQVMDFPRPLTVSESDAEIADFEARWQSDGFCFAAIDSRTGEGLLGMAGLARCSLVPTLGPCVEIGWRLARAHWRHGYATEAARAWIEFGFADLRLEAIVAFTDAANHRSLGVMRKVGMRCAPKHNFEHPDFPPGHALRPQRVFVIARGDRKAIR